jgi:hypothetical protein
MTFPVQTDRVARAIGASTIDMEVQTSATGS